MRASRMGQLDIVELMIAAGANVDEGTLVRNSDIYVCFVWLCCALLLLLLFLLLLFVAEVMIHANVFVGNE